MKLCLPHILTYRLGYILCLLFFTCSNGLSQKYIEWERNFGGSKNDQALDIIETEDGGFYVAGFTESTDGNITVSYGGKDAWLIKIDSRGFLEWEKSYGGSGDDAFTAMVRDREGNLVIAGSTTSEEFPNHVDSLDVWIVKLNKSGEILWDVTYGGSRVDTAIDIASVNDTAFVVLAETDSPEWTSDGLKETDLLVLNIDFEGKRNWHYSYDQRESGNSPEKAGSIWITKEGNFLITGSTGSTRVDSFMVIPPNTLWNDTIASEDLLVIKLNREGDSLLWEKRYGGLSDERGAKIMEDENGSIIVLGGTKSFEGDITNNEVCIYEEDDPNPRQDECFDGWIMKLDKNGEMIYNNTIGEGSKEFFVDGFCTNNGEMIVIGEVNLNLTNPRKGIEFWTLNLDDQFKVKGQTYHFGSYGLEYVKAGCVLNNSTIVMAGGSTRGDEDVSTNFGEYDFWIVKLSNKCTTRPQTPSENLLDFFCENDGIELEYGIDLYDRYYFNNHNRTFSSKVPLISADIPTSRLKDFYSSFYQEKDGCFSRGLYLEFPFPLAMNDTLSLDVLAPPEELLPLANDVILRNGTDLSIITDAGIGKAYVSNDSTIIYEPSPYNLAIDSFEYQVCDALCLHICDTARVLISRTDELNVYEAPNQIGFTPNGDGVNDELSLNFLNPGKQNELIIFNRWGQVVFERRSYEDDWDGKQNGRLLPPGPYYFTLKSTENGKLFNGLINLLY